MWFLTQKFFFMFKLKKNLEEKDDKFVEKGERVLFKKVLVYSSE